MNGKSDCMEKEFHFKVRFAIDEDHPLYDCSDSVIEKELAILLTDVLSVDPMLEFDCEVIR